MFLVGLHIYYKMIHGPYNIKESEVNVSGTSYIFVLTLVISAGTDFSRVFSCKSEDSACMKAENGYGGIVTHWKQTEVL